jgi:hypothetical protein
MQQPINKSSSKGYVAYTRCLQCDARANVRDDTPDRVSDLRWPTYEELLQFRKKSRRGKWLHFA